MAQKMESDVMKGSCHLREKEKLKTRFKIIFMDFQIEN